MQRILAQPLIQRRWHIIAFQDGPHPLQDRQTYKTEGVLGKEGYCTSSLACLDSPYAGQCTFCTMCTSGAHHTPASSLPPCAPAPPMLQPLSPSCAARHQKTLHLGRPRLETERGMRGESSQQQQQFCHTGSAAQQQQHCTSSRREEGGLAGWRCAQTGEQRK